MPHQRRMPLDEWIRNSVEQDVLSIANDKFFNTPAAVKVEVERRLAAMKDSLARARRRPSSGDIVLDVLDELNGQDIRAAGLPDAAASGAGG